MAFTTTRFLDTATAEPATQLSENTETPSMAESLAKGGVFKDGNDDSDYEQKITEQKEETQTPEATPVATTTEPKVVETKTETPATTEPVKAAEPQKVVTAEKVQTWQEVLKQQPDSVFKELGLGEKAVKLVNELKDFEQLDYFTGLLNEWKTTGKIDTFARELSTDYSKMPAEDVMRHQLRAEYPKASKEQLDVLYDEEVVEKYKIDPELNTPEEVRRGVMLLEAKADKYRDELSANQSKYLTPKPPEPTTKVDETAQAEQLQRQQEIENMNSVFEQDAATKNIIANKAFTFGDGDDKFTFPVDPNALIDYIRNGDPTGELTLDNIVRNQDGSIKTGVLKAEDSLLVATIRKYGSQAFLSELAKHYKSLGGEKISKSIENAKPPEGTTGSPAAAKTTSMAGAAAKSGVLVSGGGD